MPRPQQINFQVDYPDLLDDLRLVAHRRGQSLSEFIRRTLEAELRRDAEQSVVEEPER